MPLSVENYVMKLKGTQAATAAALRDLIRRTAPGLRESMKRGRAVYEAGGPICYFHAADDHVALGFWNGDKLKGASPRLEPCGHGRVMLRLYEPAEVDVAEVAGMIDVAAGAVARELRAKAKEAAALAAAPEDRAA